MFELNMDIYQYVLEENQVYKHAARDFTLTLDMRIIASLSETEVQ